MSEHTAIELKCQYQSPRISKNEQMLILKTVDMTSLEGPHLFQFQERNS